MYYYYHHYYHYYYFASDLEAVMWVTMKPATKMSRISRGRLRRLRLRERGEYPGGLLGGRHQGGQRRVEAGGEVKVLAVMTACLARRCVMMIPEGVQPVLQQ